LAIDPGLGFAKRTEHNLELLARLAELQALGRPLLLGASRKGFIGRVLGERPADRRLAGGLALIAHAQSRGAVQIVRVHDVAETYDTVEMMAAIQRREIRTPRNHAHDEA
jgi:dihydropteroate synthase